MDYLRKMDMDKPSLGMEDVERRMVYEVAKGMQFLHKKGVMHGDFKVGPDSYWELISVTHL